MNVGILHPGSPRFGTLARPLLGWIPQAKIRHSMPGAQRPPPLHIWGQWCMAMCPIFLAPMFSERLMMARLSDRGGAFSEPGPFVYTHTSQ